MRKGAAVKDEWRPSAAWETLEILARGADSPQDRQRLQELSKDDGVHAGELIEQAMRHKLLPRLAWHVGRGDLAGLVPRYVRTDLRNAILLNQHRTKLLRKEAARVAAALKGANVRCACTKGIVFESTLYGGLGVRSLFDVDFMIQPSDRERVAAILLSLGFSPGVYDWAQQRIVFDRREQMLYRLNPDHLPHHVRVLDDPVVRYLDVDVANSLTWERSPWSVPVADALAELTHADVPGTDASIPAMVPAFQLLFATLHLFREAWLHRYVVVGSDVSLAKFADIFHLLRLQGDAIRTGGFADLVQRYEVRQPVAWVLEHMDRAFGGSLGAKLALSQGLSEDWLASAQAPEGPLRWTGSMRQRLAVLDRVGLFSPVH